jgi:hydrogenase-1 operon protein HyaF
LAAIDDGLSGVLTGAASSAWVDAATLSRAARAHLASLLGQGEITATLTGPASASIRETSLPGVWLVDAPGRQGIEISLVPTLIAQAAARPPRPLDLPEVLADGAMNVRPVLGEIAHHLSAPDQTHEINLTLLPMTEEDHRVLADALGPARVDLWTRGYGSCHVVLTELGRVWRIRHFTSEERLILDLVQVGGIPVAIAATLEDMADAQTRIRELSPG